ncbi:hypothetical protein BDFB_001232 [Asbolus verrucosus]|uniref:Uncharacterized protein n=1 Tax=Asbolus verrucosus TaxID=1661398 RepID=A0A482V8Q7_ASBVE|nr:hypothetical protein BDFB_001232 [Asbolus verrucosus]
MFLLTVKFYYQPSYLLQFRLQLDSFVKQREGHCAAIWGQIAAVVNSHVSQTDARRLHLAELKRLDAESAAEIATNQERINSQEAEIETLNRQLKALQEKRAETIRNLKKKLKDDTADFFDVRKQLRKDVEKDEKKLIALTRASNRSVEFLEKIRAKGAQIVNLMSTCRKFETEREQITKWLPLCAAEDVDEEEEVRPTTSAKTEEMVKKVVISVKSPQPSPPSSLEAREVDAITSQFASLMNLEKFWMVYSKVDLEFREMKEEKKLLTEQNKHFRGMIRAVLEAAALDQTCPNSKVSTRVASKRGPRSAPLRRILI